MNFEWDEPKNRANRLKHGVSFEDVTVLFATDSQLIVDIDDRYDYGEDRWIGIGALGDLVVVVVFTEPRHDTVRIISVRKANQNEQDYYFRSVHN
ncbi:MAG: BrnT family toxin [Caldilineaceae bacterium]|nr:BrnT family toxin [Caldilineaceae bacterium]